MPDPAVTCLCLTFARPPRLLEEAVYSFLRQDYPGPKELLILNDFPRQTIVFDHPQVTVVNAPNRFHTVGEKRNAAVALARHDLLAVWDDDDIYLPHRLTLSLSHYDPARRFFKPTRAFVLSNGVLRGPDTNLFHSGSLWHRSLFDEVGGYAHMGSGEDVDIEAKFKRIIGPGKNYDAIHPHEIYYLYRWLGTESYHLSAFGRDTPTQSGNDQVMEYVERQIEQCGIPTGKIVLAPQWTTDYTRMVSDYVAQLAAGSLRWPETRAPG